MKKASIILFIALLLVTISSENVKAGSPSSVPKKQGNNLVVGLFKLADKIFEFSGDILTLGNKEKEAKVEKTSIEKPVVQKEQKLDLVENLSSFGEDTIKYSWNIITLGYDEQEHDDYQECPTYKQWKNAEAMLVFMLIAECLANGAVGDGL